MEGRGADQLRLDDVSCHREMGDHIGAGQVVLEGLVYRIPPVLTVPRVGGKHLAQLAGQQPLHWSLWQVAARGR
jgi:hypothetical protein